MSDLGHRNLLVCSYYMPQPDCDSYSRRLFHLVGFLRDAGCAVTCVAKNPRGVDSFSTLLTDRGVRVLVGPDEHVGRLLAAEFFDWALLGFWNIAEPLVETLRAASPATKIVVDSGDVHFLRHARRILQEADGRLGLLDQEFARDTIREINVYAAADAVLAVSRKEADLVADLIGDPRRTFAVPDSEDMAPSPIPFARRRGMFFVGNFEHPPNAEALAYLCDEILPHVDPALLAEHPLYVAGSHMTEAVRGLAAGWPTARMLGWVPSVVPYLERVRASLIPLLHGAGTKRKMIQTLSIGTPTVTTSVGIEGFPLADEREVLVADDPVLFAAGITRLLTDGDLWNDLARAGRERIRTEQSHDVARARLLEALATIRAAPQAGAKAARKRPRMSHRDYGEAIRQARDVIRRFTPAGTTVAVVSRGDEALLALDGRTAWHFPRGEDGGYAGFHPATAGEAVSHLEAVRDAGAEYLAIPAPFTWWLDHYREFREHLETRYRLIDADSDHCVLFSLVEPPAGPQRVAPAAAGGDVGAETTSGTITPISFQGLDDRHVVTRLSGGGSPAISIVIPTRDRAALLAESLESLARQRADRDAFEVVVVSDGSTDGTTDVCRGLADRLPLTLVESPPSGISVAKNLGVDAAAAPLVIFFDDDDVADPGLVAAHLEAHRRYPLEHVAVLGFTDWHSRLHKTEVMRFITDVGHYLFGYTSLRPGQLLDHTFFWGGRSSCKKSLLVRAGGFRPEFTFGSEDIEAGHRISCLVAAERRAARGAGPAGADPITDPVADVALTVVYSRDAVQHMIRPITYDQFCGRCERQGRSQWQFSRFYDDRRVDEWCGVHGAARRWRDLRRELDAKVARVHELEPVVEAATLEERAPLVKELHALYWWTFEAFKTKGIVEAAGHA